MAQGQGGIYLFTGPDRYRKRERVNVFARTRAVDPLDRHETSALQLSASTLITLVRTQPAASLIRLIVIDEAHRLDGACLKALGEQAELLKQTTCLILLVDVDIDANHPLASIKPHASVEHFAWLSSHEVSRWVQRDVAAHKKRIAASAIQDLLQAYGADLAGIKAFLSQVISWVGSRPQLSQADVRVFLRVPVTKSQFALVDAIAKRDVATALQAVQEQLAAGKEVLELLGLLVWQLQRWLTVGQWMEAGIPPDGIAQRSGLRPWQLERMQRELADRPVDSLRWALQRCWELDVAAKSGRVPSPRVALEQLIVALCLPRTTWLGEASSGEMIHSGAQR